MSYRKKFLLLREGFRFLKKRATHVLLVTAATAANNLLAFFLNVVAARTLGVVVYGLFALALALAALVGLLGDFGFNLSMIRLFNKYQAEPKKQSILLGTVLAVKILFLAMIAVLSWPLSNSLVLHLRVHSANAGLWAVAFITGGFLFLWTYQQAYLQAHRSFKHLAAYIGAFAALRLGGVLVALLYFPRNPMAWLMVAYTVPAMVLIFIGVALKSKNMVSAFRRPNLALDVLKELLSYSKWVALSSFAYTSMPHVVRFLLATRASVEEVGVFSAGMTFTVAFSTLNTALRTILFPHVTALKGDAAIERYLSRIARVTPYYAGIAVPGIIGLGLLQCLLLGEEYQQALPVFAVTAGAMVVSLFISMQTMLLHTAMRPDIDAKIDVVRLVLLAILVYFVAARFGAFGSAFIYALIMVLGAWSKVVIARRVVFSSGSARHG